MVKNTKTWIPQERTIIFLWNKKILNLCLRWQILRSYRFVGEVTFKESKNPSHGLRRIIKLVRSDLPHTECWNSTEVRWAQYKFSQKDIQCALSVITKPPMASWRLMHLGTWCTLHIAEAIGVLVITGKTHCLFDYINIAPILPFKGFSTLCVMSHLTSFITLLA